MITVRSGPVSVFEKLKSGPDRAYTDFGFSPGPGWSGVGPGLEPVQIPV